MSHNTKNYSEQGGDKLVIGGELEIKEGARVVGLDADSSVEANPSSNGTTELTKIKIGGTTYKIPKVTVDSSLNSQSENPVQNKKIYAELDKKQDKLTSGTSIKTINGESILGNGNIVVGGSSEEIRYYLHTVSTSYFTFQFVCSYANPFTTQTLATWLRNKGFDSDVSYLIVNKHLTYKEWAPAGYTQVDLPNGGIYYKGTTASLGFITPNIKIYGNVSSGTGNITEITKINVENATGFGDLTITSDIVVGL